MIDFDLTTILAAVQAVVIAYIIYKQTLGKATVDNRPAEVKAYAELQVELGRAAENLVEPLNRRIEEQQRQLTKQFAEIEQLRSVIRTQSNQITELTKRVNEVERRNGDLEAELAVSVENEERLAERLTRIRKEIDTGPLTGPRRRNGKGQWKE